ncbi:hypothetical protein [Streptomyces sp. NBC_01497]|uniref:hypothetical protein n=1 Tax=Streptomyces sp. NBC_01497 TaxID=2903885 RepID=UPI002E2F1C30|nr:hypothetical protein [Streptomyces sp. NBC_01497]
MAQNDDFYTHDRPNHPTLPEDRPRGGAARSPKGGKTWGAVAIVVVVVALVVVGIALFP